MADLDLINQKLDHLISLLESKSSEAKEILALLQKPKQRPVKVTDEEWLAELKQSPAYSHIQWDVEFAKMDAWFALPKNSKRQRTREFILNWINKVDRPFQVEKPKLVTTPVYHRDPKPIPKGEACPPEVAAKLSRLYGKDFSF